MMLKIKNRNSKEQLGVTIDETTQGTARIRKEVQ